MTSTRPVQLIAVDLDGTLLNSHHQLTNRTLEALRRAIADGVQVILATGKTRVSALEAIRQLDLDTPGVYLQGLVVTNGDGSVRHQTALDDQAVLDIASYAREHDVSMVGYSCADIFTERRTDQTDKLMAFHEPPVQEITAYKSLLAERRINKILLIDQPERVTDVRAHLSELFGDRLTFVQALPDMLEILPPGASKGAGLRWLLDDLDVAPENVLAIGDGENDVEMLQLAGIGVAVGNAMPQAKAVADYVVASNDHDGVAEAIERFVLVDQSTPS